MAGEWKMDAAKKRKEIKDKKLALKAKLEKIDEKIEAKAVMSDADVAKMAAEAADDVEASVERAKITAKEQKESDAIDAYRKKNPGPTGPVTAAELETQRVIEVEYHVVPLGWGVELNGRLQRSSRSETRVEAVKKAEDMAKKNAPANVVVYGEGGHREWQRWFR